MRQQIDLQKALSFFFKIYFCVCNAATGFMLIVSNVNLCFVVLVKKTLLSKNLQKFTAIYDRKTHKKVGSIGEFLGIPAIYCFVQTARLWFLWL
jgi:hypothetical protein